MRTIDLKHLTRLRNDGRGDYADALLQAGTLRAGKLHVRNAALEAVLKAHAPERLESKEPPKTRGLGDLVHLIAAPVARVIDRVLGTDLEHCGSCAKRRERLNRL